MAKYKMNKNNSITDSEEDGLAVENARKMQKEM
jgi:hypothetical protein